MHNWWKPNQSYPYHVGALFWVGWRDRAPVNTLKRHLNGPAELRSAHLHYEWPLHAPEARLKERNREDVCHD